MSENVLSWAKRIKLQRAQSTIMKSLTETMEFNKIKVTKMHTRTVQEDTHRQRYPQSRHADIVVAAIPQDNVWHMGRHTQNIVKLATSEWCAEEEKPGP